MQDQWWHFSGIAGAGMNPLAQLMAARGVRVQGSDRSLDQGQNQAIAERLQAAGIALVPQDGSGIQAGLTRLVHSTAVEDSTPEMQAAIQLNITRQTRPALLAELVGAAQPGIAIAGTSGKSTVVGMLAWILRYVQRPATVLGGAALAVDGASHMGCFQAGSDADPLLAEACESDGTLIGYHPAIGLVHNISRDHGELDAVKQQFATFMAQCELLFVNARCREAMALAKEHPRLITYGQSSAAEVALEPVRIGPWRAEGTLSFSTEEVFIDLPQPGMHTLENAAAAAVVADHLGINRMRIAAALGSFPGVARRFQPIGITADHIRVIDDYAHNGDKLRAAISAAQAGADRVICIFQPHGYGPARFLRPELRAILPDILRRQDRFCYSEIYYAGGTVQADISSRDLAADLQQELGRPVGYAESHEAVLSWVTEQAGPGDTVLLMGARDPRLADLARAIHAIL